jgi:hypothetical protein
MGISDYVYRGDTSLNFVVPQFNRSFDFFLSTFSKNHISSQEALPKYSTSRTSIMASSGKMSAVNGGSGTMSTPGNNVGGNAAGRRVNPSSSYTCSIYAEAKPPSTTGLKLSGAFLKPHEPKAKQRRRCRTSQTPVFQRSEACEWLLWEHVE